MPSADLIGLLLFVYTVVLIGLGRLGLLHNRDAAGFVTAGRRLNPWQVFVLVTAMWVAWIYVTELDEGFAVGISAIWFGVAVLIMSLVVAVLFVTPFRQLGFVTNSGLLGDAFGRTARTLSALVIALTFPIFALGNVLVAAAVLHSLFGWPLVLAEGATLAVMVMYVAFGGLVSLVYTQAVNLAVMGGGILAVGIYAVGRVGITTGPISTWAGGHPWDWVGIGVGPILVWVFSDLVNVVSAQVEFQAVTAVDNPRIARRAVLWSTVALAVVTIGAAYLGLAAHAVRPQASTGILAFPALVLNHAPLWVQLAGTGSVWAAALTWSAPLLFSGATSLGLDVARPALHVHRPEYTRQLIRWALPIQAIAVIAYTLLRPGDLAWWSVFGLTLRNAAIFAPTVGLLLWPAGRSGAAVAAMIGGVGTGLAWNALTGFSPAHFALGINPAWLGTTVSIVVFLAGSAWETRDRGRWQAPDRGFGYTGWAFAGAATALLAGAWGFWAHVGMTGPLLLTGAIGLELGVVNSWRVEATEPQSRLSGTVEGYSP